MWLCVYTILSACCEAEIWAWHPLSLFTILGAKLFHTRRARFTLKSTPFTSLRFCNAVKDISISCFSSQNIVVTVLLTNAQICKSSGIARRSSATRRKLAGGQLVCLLQDTPLSRSIRTHAPKTLHQISPLGCHGKASPAAGSQPVSHLHIYPRLAFQLLPPFLSCTSLPSKDSTGLLLKSTHPCLHPFLWLQNDGYQRLVDISRSFQLLLLDRRKQDCLSTTTRPYRYVTIRCFLSVWTLSEPRLFCSLCP